MKRLLFLLCSMLLVLAPAFAQPVGSAALKTASGLVGTDLMREIYRVARSSALIPQSLQDNIVHSIAQVHIPDHPYVLGTAWLANYNNQFWAVMPYHIGGKAGSKRELYLYDSYGRTKKINVTIAVNGNAGFHSPDVSVAPLPDSLLKGNIPLNIAPVNMDLPAYTFGYTIGSFGPKDFFPMRRWILAAEGVGLMGNRSLSGEVPGRTLDLSGYCGSPLLQLLDGEWKVVGMHEGSVINSKTDLTQNLTFASDIPKAFDLLFEALEQTPEESARQLLFNGFFIGRLLHTERIKTIEVIRDGERIFTQDLRNFPHPYSDLHSELAFAGKHLLPGDKLIYHIQGESRQMREVEYVVP